MSVIKNTTKRGVFVGIKQNTNIYLEEVLYSELINKQINKLIMNKLNKFSRATIAIAMMLCVALPSFAHDFEVNGIYYNYLDETAKTVEVTYKGSYYDSYSNEYTGAVSIPSSVTYNSTTYSVTSIGFYAFRGCTGLTSITIPNSVTSIGFYAFEDTGWYNNQPDGILYLDNCCLGYKGNKPTGTLSIKEGARLICSYAFFHCDGLTSVTIGNSVTSIGDWAFCNCSGLTEVNFNVENCTSMGSYNYPVFESCPNLKTINIGNSVKTIPKYAFSGCSGLTSITIPNSVTSIGEAAFFECEGLTEVNISDLSAWCKIDFSDYRANPFCYAKKLKLNGSEIKDLVIPNDITEIKNYAFCGCNGLTSVTIGNSVTSIGEYAFDCNNLRIVKSLSNTPLQCNDNAFGSNPAALLMVPKGSMMSYMIADGWRHFTKIQEFEVDDAVKPVLTIAYPEGGVIKQKVDNGTILELQIVPSNGWKCNSVTFNGIDVTNQLDANGNYNTPSITANSQLSIVFVKNDGSVANALVDSDIKVYVKGNTVTITGADEFSDVEIYNTAGTTIYTGIDKSITIDSTGIYILTVEGRTFKFAM